MLSNELRQTLHAILIVKINSETITPVIAYEYYESQCRIDEVVPVTLRRFGDFINQLNDLGIIKVDIISKGRFGRRKYITTQLSNAEIEDMIRSKPIVN